MVSSIVEFQLSSLCSFIYLQILSSLERSAEPHKLIKAISRVCHCKYGGIQEVPKKQSMLCSLRSFNPPNVSRNQCNLIETGLGIWK